jgi:hypothetical protein
VVVVDAIIAFILVAAVVIGIILLLASIFNSPERQIAKKELVELEKETRVSRNHQDMFLFINELVALDAYEAIFPRSETVEKAKQLIQTYREETTK